MNIIFMGTPDFAVPSLKALVENGHNVMRVYSQPDKPKGRGHKLMPTEVKEYALSVGLEVAQPVSVKKQAVIDEIRELKPDCIVVVAYGKMLPKALLEVPSKGCINVHGSLLPKYRGAAPIQWAVLNGDKTTGVTTMFMGEGMDTGDMLLKKETDILYNESSGELFDRLKEIGAEALIETLEKLGEITPEVQDESLATHAPMISKEMCKIDFNNNANHIQNQVNGLKPWPSAKMIIDGKPAKLLLCDVIEKNGEAGSFFENENKLCVYCGKNALVIRELQPDNKKKMTGESYLLGHPIK